MVSIHEDMGVNFVQTVASNASGGEGQTLVDGQRYDLKVCGADPEHPEQWTDPLEWADTVVLQLRFMDVGSMDKLRTICRSLTASTTNPLSVFLLREEGEVDFKMSCPFCGQKLWVRDSDAGKRGRCPNCKKAFRLPGQADHAKSQLGLPDTVPVARVTRGNPASCRNALTNLKGREAGGIMFTGTNVDPDILMKTTVRIEVPNTETQPGEPDA